MTVARLFSITIISFVVIILIYHYHFPNLFETSVDVNDNHLSQYESNPPLIYIYLLNENSCSKYPSNGLDYITLSLEHSLISAKIYDSRSPVIFASNFKECPQFEEFFDKMNSRNNGEISKFDISLSQSNKTNNFTHLGQSFFQK